MIGAGLGGSNKSMDQKVRALFILWRMHENARMTDVTKKHEELEKFTTITSEIDGKQDRVKIASFDKGGI